MDELSTWTGLLIGQLPHHVTACARNAALASTEAAAHSTDSPVYSFSW